MTQHAKNSESLFPPVEAPSRAEEAVLNQRGARLRDAIDEALRAWCKRSCTVQYKTYTLFRHANEIPGGEEAMCAVLHCGGFAWWVVMCRWQVRLLTANVLGLTPPNKESGGLTAVEHAVFADIVDDLARFVANKSASTEYSATVSLTAQPPPALPSIGFSYVIAPAHGDAEILLLAPWDDLRPTLSRIVGDKAAVDHEALKAATVEVAAYLATVQVSLSEVLGLRCGDVIRLGPVGVDAYLSIAGCRFATGRAGCKNGRMAVNIRDHSSRDT